MKAQMQFMTAISEAGKLSGTSFNIVTLLKDIPHAAIDMVKAGTNPWSSIKDALKFAKRDKKQAIGTAYQFTVKDVEHLDTKV
jgi:hypothetical protein